jgi:MFS family permease
VTLPPGAWRSAAPAVLMAAWGGNHFSPLLLLYRQVDGYSAVEVDLFFACYVLGLMPGFLVAGPLSDRHGRRRLVAAALALGVAGSLILAFGSASVLWMCAGRLVSGASVAVAMVAGTSWIKELSEHDAGPARRARRASLTLTAGFGLGAGVSGALAQWGPAPTLLPYAVQIVLSLAAAVPLAAAPETRIPDGARTRSLRADLRIPAAARRRFAGVVLPMAPWVFAAPALAFVVAPAVVAEHTGAPPIGSVAYAALLAVVTLCCGAAVQPLVPRLARRTRGRAATAGLAAVTAGTIILAFVPAPIPAAFTAVLFGAGYGVCIVSGLVEVQAMADPEALAGLTGIYYSLTYVGFALPVVLAALAHVAAYRTLLVGVALLCLACAGVVARRSVAQPVG